MVDEKTLEVDRLTAGGLPFGKLAKQSELTQKFQDLVRRNPPFLREFVNRSTKGLQCCLESM